MWVTECGLPTELNMGLLIGLHAHLHICGNSFLGRVCFMRLLSLSLWRRVVLLTARGARLRAITCKRIRCMLVRPACSCEYNLGWQPRKWDWAVQAGV